MIISVIAVIFAALCSIATPAPQPRIEFDRVTFISKFDNKVITTTEYIEDPGPYNIYASIAQNDQGLPDQRWSAYVYDDSSINVSPLGGQFWNSFSTYKPCPDCFATNENWDALLQNSTLELFSPSQILNSTAMLKSRWTDLCLTNPGDNYLMKGPCNASDIGQIWTIVWLDQ
ncbi:uncharacterized protein LOC110862456 [Folsomia candida]|uniref:Ricin B lectin domain-containing protein n=1 Tax=Folsomia candida TaxID=158441 RepID=A0A226CXW6_FOLCA|nr:uncharacterized protein LOC110862456 [Folsomia candida]OXA37454.1 hypothetical protein Fcan01_27782 [Folsomia candida]